tara:strand:- start:5736 stop:6086 length:351 start_codon:yes stop_codon:yes gene_type:complete
MEKRKLTKEEQELYDSLQLSPVSMQGGYGVFIKSNGEEVQVNPSNGSNFDLEEMQTYVGGYIEIISMGNQTLVLNEEGKLKGLPINNRATQIFKGHFGDLDFIVGDVLVCPSEMLK